jgi:mRNA interferase RelE/StbE
MYTLEFKAFVAKDFKQISTREGEKIWQRIQSLKTDPFPRGSRKLMGRETGYRLRQGNYRILYQVITDIQKIIVIQVGHRKDIYR